MAINLYSPVTGTQNCIFKYEHVSSTSFSRIRVDLAVQVYDTFI